MSEAKILRILMAIEEDDIANEVAECGGNHEDDIWCPMCEIREDGINAYRKRLLEWIKEDE